jgi:solute carrier family 25 S-adenosylmethionine transporter 26
MKPLLVLGSFVQLLLIPTAVMSLQPMKAPKSATKLASTMEDVVSLVPPMEQTPAILIENPNSGLQSSQSPAISVWKLALAGAIATVTSDMAMHPIDCLKTLQQSQHDLSMPAAAHLIYTQLGGLQGFYRGFLTYAGCDAIAGAIKFGTYETLKQRLHQSLPSDGGLFRAALFGCAAMSFVTSSVIAVPGELLKQLLQVGHFQSCFDAVESIWQANGIAGFYQGYDGMFLRDVPYTALELGLYDLFKGLYMSEKQQQGLQDNGMSSRNGSPSLPLATHEQICIAGLTGGITGLLTTPIDVIKTKLMVDPQFEGSSFMSASMMTVQEHGWGALFAGADARVAWLVPLVAMYLPTYDFIKDRLSAEDQSLA